jgi:hypothetical protein
VAVPWPCSHTHSFTRHVCAETVSVCWCTRSQLSTRLECAQQQQRRQQQGADRHQFYQGEGGVSREQRPECAAPSATQPHARGQTTGEEKPRTRTSVMWQELRQHFGELCILLRWLGAHFSLLLEMTLTFMAPVALLRCCCCSSCSPPANT